MTGKVLWFNSAKGYGFISHTDGPDLFVHFTNIQGEGYKQLKQDEEVEFDVGVDASKKIQAVNVVKRSNRTTPVDPPKEDAPD